MRISDAKIFIRKLLDYVIKGKLNVMFMRRQLILTAIILSIFGSICMPFLFSNNEIQATSTTQTYIGLLDASVEVIKPTSEWSAVESEFGVEINGSDVKVAILDTGIDTAHCI